MSREIGLTQVFIFVALLFTLYRVRRGLPRGALRAWRQARRSRDWKAAYHFAHGHREYRDRRVGLGWRAPALTPPPHENRPR